MKIVHLEVPLDSLPQTLGVMKTPDSRYQQTQKPQNPGVPQNGWVLSLLLNKKTAPK